MEAVGTLLVGVRYLEMRTEVVVYVPNEEGKGVENTSYKRAQQTFYATATRWGHQCTGHS